MTRTPRTNKRKAAQIVDEEVEEDNDQPRLKKTKEEKTGDEEKVSGKPTEEDDGWNEPWSHG